MHPALIHISVIPALLLQLALLTSALGTSKMTIWGSPNYPLAISQLQGATDLLRRCGSANQFLSNGQSALLPALFYMILLNIVSSLEVWFDIYPCGRCVREQAISRWVLRHRLIELLLTYAGPQGRKEKWLPVVLVVHEVSVPVSRHRSSGLNHSPVWENTLAASKAEEPSSPQVACWEKTTSNVWTLKKEEWKNAVKTQLVFTGFNCCFNKLSKSPCSNKWLSSCLL